MSGLHAVATTTLGVTLILNADGRYAGHLYTSLVGSWVASFCSFGFFLIFYRELAGRRSPVSLRQAGLIAAVVYALIVVLVYSPALLRVPNAWLYILPTIVSGCFFWVFYALPDPLDSPITRALAGALVLLSVYAIYRNLTALGTVVERSPSQIIGTSVSVLYYVCLIVLMAMIVSARSKATVVT